MLCHSTVQWHSIVAVQLQYTGSTPYSSSSSENVHTPHQSSPPALQIPNDMDTLLSAIDIQLITGFGTNPGAMGFTSSDPTQIGQDTDSLNAGTNRPSQLMLSHLLNFL